MYVRAALPEDVKTSYPPVPPSRIIKAKQISSRLLYNQPLRHPSHCETIYTHDALILTNLHDAGHCREGPSPASSSRLQTLVSTPAPAPFPGLSMWNTAGGCTAVAGCISNSSGARICACEDVASLLYVFLVKKGQKLKRRARREVETGGVGRRLAWITEMLFFDQDLSPRVSC